MDSSSDRSDRTIDRRQFVGSLAAASTLTILPRHVLGGPLHVAPSDRLNVAQIGCGTQGIRQTSVGLVQREDVQIVCVCDPNTDSTNYVDWSRYGNRDSVRRLLENPTWGENDAGIRGGREVAREIIEAYYGKARTSGSYAGVRAYADFRQLLDEETDLDAAVIITPDHTHAAISVAALERGVAAISHKPVSNVLNEVRRAVDAAKSSSAATHLLAYGDHEDLHRLEAWIRSGAIGVVRAVHNWTARPFWPQGWLDYPAEQPPVPEGFDWDLWLGPEPHRPYHPSYTFALYRGWFNYGGGCFADMGNYSLWRIYQILGLDAPASVEARANTVAFLDEHNVSQFRLSQVAFPMAGSLHFRHPTSAGGSPVDVHWYEGGVKPETPDELRAVGEVLDNEGMLFVGDRGKILCGFRGHEPRLFADGTQLDPEELPAPAVTEILDQNDAWIFAVRDGGKSVGSFESVAPLAEATALGGVAFRMAGRRLDWDSDSLTISNDEEANRYVRRTYREGWEM